MLGAAKHAAQVAPVGAPVEVLNGILVESNEDTGEIFLTATNHDVSIQQKVTASVSESGSMLVNARMLVGMLSLLPGELVIFSTAKQEILSVTSGTSVYNIICLPSKHYPKPVMPFPEETVKMTGICSLAKRTVFAASKDNSKPSLQCVNVKLRNNAIHAAACDGMHLMMVKDDKGSPDEQEFMLPGRSLQLLASISTDADIFEVGDIGKEIAFTRGDMIFTMKKLPGEFIDTSAVIKGIKPVYSAVTYADKLKNALDIMVTGAGDVPINISLSDGQIIFRRNTDYSEAQTAIPAVISKDMPEEGFCYDIGCLVKLFQLLDDKIRMEFDAKGVLLVKTKNEVYFQLPQRVSAKKSDADNKVNQAA
jgi:DNA polymerase III sliding clamp (beta) subunit (PCNA family)